QTPWVNEAIIGSFAMAGKAENVQPVKAVGATSTTPVNPPAQTGADLAPVATTEGDNQANSPLQQSAALDFAAPDRTVPASVSPSFPCNGRPNPTENAICQDGDLATLDQTLSSAYGVINAALPKDLQAKLKANQTAWRAQRDECGADAACIGVSYRQRLAFLKSLVDKAAGTPSTSPSFPCGGRLNPSERAICQSDTLARLDLALDSVFKARFRNLAKADQVALSASQTAWRTNRDRCGTTASCIEAAYRQRLSYFQSLQ
ncbi:lysozyme inhibitor LprI family protein, partial [Labrys sp. (in: a-proteobacteria)]|uniref:lysozyme inhibitor LprI family protein n=1 Tax=Labrys sp. (in: a-proteobacteria) TaxID=1917972 RepID=UPI0039E327F8